MIEEAYEAGKEEYTEEKGYTYDDDNLEISNNYSGWDNSWTETYADFEDTWTDSNAENTFYLSKDKSIIKIHQVYRNSDTQEITGEYIYILTKK